MVRALKREVFWATAHHLSLYFLHTERNMTCWDYIFYHYLVCIWLNTNLFHSMFLAEISVAMAVSMYLTDVGRGSHLLPCLACQQSSQSQSKAERGSRCRGMSTMAVDYPTPRAVATPSCLYTSTACCNLSLDEPPRRHVETAAHLRNGSCSGQNVFRTAARNAARRHCHGRCALHDNGRPIVQVADRQG